MKDFNETDINGYESLLETLEYEIVYSGEFGDYQGDYLVMFKKDNRFGYLQFGFGSCSGCDSYQSCENKEELIDLRDSLNNDIQWKSPKEMISFLENRDWEGCVSFYDKEQELEFKNFIATCLKKIIPLALIEN